MERRKMTPNPKTRNGLDSDFGPKRLRFGTKEKEDGQIKRSLHSKLNIVLSVWQPDDKLNRLFCFMDLLGRRVLSYFLCYSH